MDKQFLRKWGVPGRPFELETLSLAFIFLGSFYPSMIPSVVEATPSMLHQSSMVELIWMLGLIGGFVAYLGLQRTLMNYNSTPAISLFAPLYFGGLCYGRIYQVAQAKGVTLPLFSGSLLQILGYSVALVAGLLLVSRVGVLRRLMRYREVEWDLIVEPVRDRTFLTDLSRAVLPLFYRVKEYRFCEEGILIVGFHYVCAIPFRSVESVEHVEQFSSYQAATYYAGSSRSLIQLQLSDNFQPIMFGPERRDEVLRYCQQQAPEHLVIAKIKVRSLADDPQQSQTETGGKRRSKRATPVAANLRRAFFKR